MCHLNLEQAKVWREDKHKARRDHRCSCCYSVIPKGQSYLAHFSAIYDTTESSKLCADCERDRATFADAHEGMLCSPDFLFSLLLECVPDDPDYDDAQAILWRFMIARMKGTRDLFPKRILQ